MGEDITAYFICGGEEGPQFIQHIYFLANRESVEKLRAACDSHLKYYDDARVSRINDRWMERETQRMDEMSRTPRNRRKKMGFVYMMRCNRTSRIKIGFSVNPNYREKTLQSENPDVALIWKKEGTRDDEMEMHARFSAYRFRGEWFNLPESELTKIKESGEGEFLCP